MCSENYLIEDFNLFLNTWAKPYSELKYILHYLKTYPELLSKIGLDDIIDPQDIDTEQQDWVRLCTKFYHPLDKEFFKPYWTPIGKDSLDYFMDISEDSYPIFEVKYYWLEPYRWYKKYLTKDILELLLAPDEGINFAEFKERNEIHYRNSIKELGDKRRSLGFDRIFYVQKVRLQEIPIDCERGIDYTIADKGTPIQVQGVTPLIIGLLPHDIPIELKSLKVKYGDDFNDLDEVKNVRDMVHILRKLNNQGIKSYSIDLLKTNGHIVFKENCVIFEVSDIDLRQDIIVALESLASH